MNKTMNNLDITDISNLSIEDTTWIVHLVDYVGKTKTLKDFFHLSLVSFYLISV